MNFHDDDKGQQQTSQIPIFVETQSFLDRLCLDYSNRKYIPTLFFNIKYVTKKRMDKWLMSQKTTFSKMSAILFRRPFCFKTHFFGRFRILLNFEFPR